MTAVTDTIALLTALCFVFAILCAIADWLERRGDK